MTDNDRINRAADAGGPEDRPESPIPPARYAPQALANAARTCRACGEVTRQGARCKACGRFLPANQTRRTTGASARYQPAEVLMSADQLLDAIVADKGGADAMTALERSLAAKLRDVDVLLTISKNAIVRAGLDTQAGQRAHDRFLAALDRFTRIAAMLGLERRPRKVTSFTDALLQMEPVGKAARE